MSPPLLCSGCSLSDSDVASQAKYGYKRLKSLDPYHPTIGAVNGGCSARFSDATTGGSEKATVTVDYNMQENYGTDLQATDQHIGDGEKDAYGHYVGGDAFMRARPLEFERECLPNAPPPQRQLSPVGSLPGDLSDLTAPIFLLLLLLLLLLLA